MFSFDALTAGGAKGSQPAQQSRGGGRTSKAQLADKGPGPMFSFAGAGTPSSSFNFTPANNQPQSDKPPRSNPTNPMGSLKLFQANNSKPPRPLLEGFNAAYVDSTVACSQSVAAPQLHRLDLPDSPLSPENPFPGPTSSIEEVTVKPAKPQAQASPQGPSQAPVFQVPVRPSGVDVGSNLTPSRNILVSGGSGFGGAAPTPPTAPKTARQLEQQFEQRKVAKTPQNSFPSSAGAAAKVVTAKAAAQPTRETGKTSSTNKDVYLPQKTKSSTQYSPTVVATGQSFRQQQPGVLNQEDDSVMEPAIDSQGLDDETKACIKAAKEQSEGFSQSEWDDKVKGAYAKTTGALEFYQNLDKEYVMTKEEADMIECLIAANAAELVFLQSVENDVVDRQLGKCRQLVSDL